MKKKAQNDPAKAEGGANSGKYQSFIYDLPNASVGVIVPKGIAKYYGDPGQPDVRSYEEIESRFSEALNWLYARSIMGEAQALGQLVEVGTAIAHFLKHIQNEKTTKYVAGSRLEWPTTISSDDSCLGDIKRQRRQLGLGRNILIRRDKAKFRGNDKLQREVVYHCLVILRAQAFVRRELQIVQSFEKVLGELKSGLGEAITSSGLGKLLGGERAKHQQWVESTGNESKKSKRDLATLLELEPVAKATAQMLVVLQKAQVFPDLTEATAPQWVNLIEEFLIAFTGDQLEQNNVLRPLGQPRADVKIRELLSHPRNVNMTVKRENFKDHEKVVNELRYGIHLKLKKAVEHFSKQK